MFDNGHIPFSKNLFFKKLQNDDGSLKSPEEIKKIFEDHGVNFEAPITATC